MKIRSLILALTAALVAPIAYGQSADVVTVVDESGSMAGEHAWLPGMIGALETGLLAEGLGAGADANQYGIVGYGSSPHTGGGPFGQGPHDHLVGGSQWFDSASYGGALPPLTNSGGYEDGYDAINYALNNRTYRAGSATNIILVTDEDRDNPTDFGFGPDPYSYEGILNLIVNNNALLNAVVNVAFRCDSGIGATALGVDSTGTGYVADGLGSYTTCSDAVAVGGSGDSIADYVDLALATGGAAWDLNQLRAGGNTALSFTNAFVAIKVEEIQQQQQPVPEPGTLALLGLGLLGLGAARRRRIAQ